MIALWLALASVLSCLSCVVADASLYEGENEVQTFDSRSDFRKRVLEDSSGSIWLVQFYAPWCGHCQQLAPKYKEVASALRGIVNVAAVDAATEGKAGKAIASSYEIKGFPTLYFFGRDDKTHPHLHQGAREVKDLIEASLHEIGATIKARGVNLKVKGMGSRSDSSDDTKKSIESKVVNLTMKNFQSQVLDNPLVSMVAFVAPWCGHCKSLLPEWDDASLALDGQGAFLGVVDATKEEALAQIYGVQGFPTIKIFPGGPNKTSSDATDYQGERTARSIVKWALTEVDRSGIPKDIPELTSQSVLHEECEGHNRICILVALPHILDSTAEGRNKYKDLIARMAKSTRGSGAFQFVWFEGGSNQLELEKALDLTFGYPAVVGLSMEKQAYAIFRGSFNEQAVGKFVAGITTGREPIVKLNNPLPPVTTTDPWDGQDGVPFEEEPLDDFWDDDDVNTGGAEL
jgi:protein disulfide-isomerase A6